MNQSQLCDVFLMGSKKQAVSGPLSFFSNVNPDTGDVRIIQTYNEILGVLGVNVYRLYINSTRFSATSDKHGSHLVRAVDWYNDFARKNGLPEIKVFIFRWGTCRSSFIKSSSEFKDIEYELLCPRSLSNTLQNSCPISSLRYSDNRFDARIAAKNIRDNVLPRAVELSMGYEDKEIYTNIKFRLDNYIAMCTDDKRIKDIQKMYRLANKEMKKEGVSSEIYCSGECCRKIVKDYDNYWNYNDIISE